MTFRDGNLSTALTRAFSTVVTNFFSSLSPLVTPVTIVAVVAVTVRFGLHPQLPAFCYLAAVGVPLAFIDARQHRLPDVATLPSYPACLLLLGVAAPFVPGGPGRFVHALIGMAAAVGFFALLLVVSPAGIGLGDVKLAGPLGAFLGWLGAAAFVTGLMTAWLLAALTAVTLLVTHRATGKTEIPFGPFLIAATLAVVLASGLVPALAS
jgi:leader peptidase (prepilin peptidase)/N-methyltransferase